MQAKKTSRGQIVSDYLTGKMTPEQYIHTIQDKQNEYSGFNLLLGNPNHMLYYNNIDNQMRKIPVGTHSLSNHFLNTSWPKVRKGKSLLHDYVTKQEKIDPEVLFSILTDREIARDEDLPDTGVDLLLERQLSPFSFTTLITGRDALLYCLLLKQVMSHLSKERLKQGIFQLSKLILSQLKIFN